MMPNTTTASIDNLVDSIFKSFTEPTTGTTTAPTMEGVPQKKIIAQLLEELLSGRFNTNTWAKKTGFAGEEDVLLKQFLTKLMSGSSSSFDKQSIFEILLPMLKQQQQSFGTQSFDREWLLTLLFKVLLQQQNRVTPFGAYALTPATFSLVGQMSVSELKSYVRMWIRQLTFDILVVEAPTLTRESIVDRLFVKKVVGKFVDLIDTIPEEKFRHTLIDALRNINVFMVIENAFNEFIVFKKLNYLGVSTTGFSSNDELVPFLLRLLLKEPSFTTGYGNTSYGQRSFFAEQPRNVNRFYEWNQKPTQQWQSDYLPSNYGRRSEVSELIDLIKMVL